MGIWPWKKELIISHQTFRRMGSNGSSKINQNWEEWIRNGPQAVYPFRTPLRWLNEHRTIRTLQEKDFNSMLNMCRLFPRVETSWGAERQQVAPGGNSGCLQGLLCRTKTSRGWRWWPQVLQPMPGASTSLRSWKRMRYCWPSARSDARIFNEIRSPVPNMPSSCHPPSCQGKASRDGEDWHPVQGRRVRVASVSSWADVNQTDQTDVCRASNLKSFL